MILSLRLELKETINTKHFLFINVHFKDLLINKTLMKMVILLIN